MADATTIVREYIDAWNRRDWEKFRSLIGSGYSYTGGDGVKNDGIEAGVGVAEMFATAFPDGKMDVQHMHAAGNTVIVEFIGRGTHKGDLMGIAPTGKTISMSACDVVEVRDGKIVSEREYMDMANMMQQLGVMPVPATA